MKLEQLDSLKQIFPFPIAGSDNEATDIPKDSGNLNREYGFKAGYFNNNALVTKNDFNGALKSVTSNLAYGNAGGFYEFNPEVAEAIGGYAKNAVLTFMYGGSMHLVRSMHDNNLVNFNAVGVNGTDWELVLPNDDLKNDLMPDINWNARNAKLIYSLDSTSRDHGLATGTFTDKGYVVVVDNNVVHGHDEYATEWHVYLIVGALSGTDVSELRPQDIFANPLSDSIKAFPIELIDGFSTDSNDNHHFDILHQVQVQKGTNYRLYLERTNSYPISSGSYDIYFLPTPD